MNNSYIFGLICICLMVANSANAVTVNGFFQGIVTFSGDNAGVFGLQGADVYTGMTITGSFTYDTDIAPTDHDSSPNVGTYTAASPNWMQISVTLNGIMFADFGDLSTVTQTVEVVNNFTGTNITNRDSFTIVETSIDSTSQTSYFSQTSHQLLINVIDDNKSFIDNTNLPNNISWFASPGSSTAHGDVTIAHQAINVITNVNVDENTFISFDVTQLQVSPIPVPPALWLFGSGLLGLIGVARAKRRFRA